MTSVETELPLEVEDFLRRHITSHDQLKILLLMADEPARGWTHEQLARVIGGKTAEVEARVAPLVAAGLLAYHADEQRAALRFAPARPADALLVGRLRELDRQRSLVLLRAVSSHAIERIRAEARKTFGDP